MIIVIAQHRVSPDTYNRAREAMGTYVTACRQLSGVISITLTEAVDDKNTFILIEEYIDDAAMAAHGKSEPLHQMLEKIGPLLADTPSVHAYFVSEKQKWM
ncbi:MAG: antibiotic biosynthesis monooxygenase [Chloroflexi bacterium]|nr:antibiotic biosynthesis monooxygenase [Chloroflexota bacterium]